MFQWLKDGIRGFRTFAQGLGWLRAHPGYILLLFTPSAIGLLGMVWALSFFVTHDEVILGRLLFAKPEEPLWLALYYGLWVLSYIAAVVLTLVASMLVVSIIAAPLYELVSTAVEREVTGQAPPDLGVVGNIKAVLSEIKKALFILVVSLVLLAIPGVNGLSLIVSAFLMGWNFFDYPLARRGWSFSERLRFVSREFWSVLGLGLWLIVPFVQILMMPLAVTGGTLLGLDAIQRHKRLQQL